MRKFLLIVAALVLAAVLYNLDAITGQWKFDKLCANEGGSKFYAQVVRGMGWEVVSQNELAYRDLLRFGDVAFVRFRNREGALMDATLAPGSSARNPTFIVTAADATKNPRYREISEQGLMPDDERFSRRRYTIVDIQRGTPAAVHTSFSYEWTKPDRLILSASTSVTCHGGKEIDSFFASIYGPGRS
jgi:hypothetical protein